MKTNEEEICEGLSQNSGVLNLNLQSAMLGGMVENSLNLGYIQASICGQLHALRRGKTCQQIPLLCVASIRSFPSRFVYGI